MFSTFRFVNFCHHAWGWLHLSSRKKHKKTVTCCAFLVNNFGRYFHSSLTSLDISSCFLSMFSFAGGLLCFVFGWTVPGGGPKGGYICFSAYVVINPVFIVSLVFPSVFQSCFFICILYATAPPSPSFVDRLQSDWYRRRLLFFDMLVSTFCSHLVHFSCEFFFHFPNDIFFFCHLIFTLCSLVMRFNAMF